MIHRSLSAQDRADIVSALQFFGGCHTDDCAVRCRQLIATILALPLADSYQGEPESTPPAGIPRRWEIGSTLRHKRHGWEGRVVAPLAMGGLINVDVGCGIKVGEHVSDWDYVCGPGS